MRSIVSIVMVIFFLIGLFLVLDKGDKSVSILNAFARNANTGIKTLQGRG